MTPFFGVVKLLGSSRVAEYAARSLSGYLVGRFGECKFTFAGYLFRIENFKKISTKPFSKISNMSVLTEYQRFPLRNHLAVHIHLLRVECLRLGRCFSQIPSKLVS